MHYFFNIVTTAPYVRWARCRELLAGPDGGDLAAIRPGSVGEVGKVGGLENVGFRGVGFRV